MVHAIDVDLDVQPVMLEQNERRGRGAALVPDESRGLLERTLTRGESDLEALRGYAKAARVAMAPLAQREVIVQEIAHEEDHACAALGIVAAGAAWTVDDIGPVERIVEAPPAGVGGVQGVTRVGDWHDELRAGNLRDLRVDVGCARGEGASFGRDVADLGQE